MMAPYQYCNEVYCNDCAEGLREEGFKGLRKVNPKKGECEACDESFAPLKEEAKPKSRRVS
jgi:hypothetical protein